MVKKHMQRGDIPPSKDAYGRTVRFAVPAVIEMVTIALMDMIDIAMVGQVSPHAISAVGITGQPRMLVFSIFMAINIALTAIIARKKGEGDMDAAKSCLRQGILISVLVGIKMTVLAVLVARPLLEFARAHPENIDDAVTYFTITSAFLLFQVITSAICVAQRVIGNTKVVMKINITAKIVSVVLNFLLIEGRFGFPRMEVEGVAWARSIAMAVACVLAIISITHKSSGLRLSIKDKWRFEIPMLKSIGKLTGKGMLEQFGLRIGFFAYAIVIAELSSDDFAAHVIAMQLMVLSFTFAEGIGAATTSLVGQNLGKKRPDLSIMYGKIGMRLAIICAAVLSALCIIFRYQFANIFADYPHIISATAGLILILAYILPIQTSQLVMAGSLRGAGDAGFVAVTMLICVGFLRPVLAFVMAFPLGMGLTGAWLAIIIDQGLRLIMLFTRFVRGKWMTAKV